MKGLELAKKYYFEYGAPMIKEQFAEFEHLLAIGLIGGGSECFGYDDEISTDHDFEPGFCIFIPDESLVNSKVEFALERAYSKLPREFMGYQRCSLSPVGGKRHGVIRIADFFEEKTGSRDGDLTINEWFSLPDYALAEAVGGEIFYDGLGLLTDIRKKLNDMPEDVWLKKLAGNLLLMAQSGQYNYSRCISRSETGAAQLAAIEFVKSAMQVIFLLNKKYMPYYKWSFRALRDLEKFSDLEYSLEYLISSENDRNTASLKIDIIEKIASLIIDELKSLKISEGICGDLEKHAYSVNDKIRDNDIRNKNILFAV
jgi:hypothetical protein